MTEESPRSASPAAVFIIREGVSPSFVGTSDFRRGSRENPRLFPREGDPRPVSRPTPFPSASGLRPRFLPPFSCPPERSMHHVIFIVHWRRCSPIPRYITTRTVVCDSSRVLRHPWHRRPVSISQQTARPESCLIDGGSHNLRCGPFGLHTVRDMLCPSAIAKACKEMSLRNSSLKLREPGAAAASSER